MSFLEPRVTLSVVSHGQVTLLDCLLSDLVCLPRHDFEVVVTVNIPERELDVKLFPFKVVIIRNQRPAGFGANHNAAFRLSRGEFFIVINPDIRIYSMDFDCLLMPFLSNRVAAVAPSVFSAGGNIEDNARRFPTFLRLFFRFFFTRRSLDYQKVSEAVGVDWVAGMFVAFRRYDYDRVGGFDERRFFMYLEDADICRRLRELGSEIILNPAVSVTHIAQRASHRSFRHFLWHSISAVRYLSGK